MGFVLFFVAVILLTIVAVLGFIVTVFFYLITLKFKSGLKALDKWMLKIALSIDQLGNVVGSVPFNFLFIKRDGVKFGGEDDTVSYILARNYHRQSLTRFGSFMGWLLNKLDKDHLDKSIQSKIESDKEAVERFVNRNYYN